MRGWLVLAGALWCALGCGAGRSAPDDGGASGAAGSGGNSAVAGRDGGDGCVVACGPGLVCQRGSVPTCLDPTWAQWPMPNGQMEVAAGAPNVQGYTDNGDGTVTDKVTKLMWQQLTPPMDYSQAAAVAYCQGLTLAGHTDWRLPAVIELVSIVDTGTYDPSIDSTMFPGTPAVGFYWSSTLYAGSAEDAWGVYFNNGYMSYNEVSMAYSVRCVR